MRTMGQKTHGEKLQELDTKINQLIARKELMKNRFKERERKQRTRRLIQVGAIFEKYFEIEGQEQAEKVAFRSAEFIKERLDDFLKTDVEKSKQNNKIVYEMEEEKLIIPHEQADYKAKQEGGNDDGEN